MMDPRSRQQQQQQNGVVAFLDIGSRLFSEGKPEVAMCMFDAALQVLSNGSSITSCHTNNRNCNKWNQDALCLESQLQWGRQQLNSDYHSGSEDEDDEMSMSAAAAAAERTLVLQPPIDTYHEDECDVGPRPFSTVLIPNVHLMYHHSYSYDVLQMFIWYNKGLVHHAKNELAQALHMYHAVIGSVTTALASQAATAASSSTNPTTTTIMELYHLGMRAYNNVGQISYAERAEEAALVQFETALIFAKRIVLVDPSHENHNAATTESSAATATANANAHKLDCATILSNWCRVHWMMGDVGPKVHQGLKEVLRIRYSVLGWDHVDVASAHYNLGMVEYARQCNDKAMSHLLQYLQVSAHRIKQDSAATAMALSQQQQSCPGSLVCNEPELDPIPALIYVLLIKNDDKDSKMSQDLVRGLRTLQDKRQDLGPNHSEVASVLNFIGTLLFHQRELEHALLFFQEELRLEEEFLTNDSSTTATTGTTTSNNNHKTTTGTEDGVSVSVTCNNIGRILQELGRFPEAIYYYQRSLKPEYGSLFSSSTTTLDGYNRAKMEDLSSSRTGTTTTTTTNDAPKNKRKRKSHKSSSEECATTTATTTTTTTSSSTVQPATMNLYSTVWYNLGLIHDKMGAYADAIQAFQMSLTLRRAMLGPDHADVACLLYNIGVLQMEQQLLNEATDSFREALRIRRVASTGQLNDRHVVKTLQKLASLHKSKGNIGGALEACREVLHILQVSVDLEWTFRHKDMGATLREMAELHHAEGQLDQALQMAAESVRLLQACRRRQRQEEELQAAAAAAQHDEHHQHSATHHFACIEQETAALLLIGSLQHELCNSVQARATFAEAARLIQINAIAATTAATSNPALVAPPSALLPLLEVSTLLASSHCAPQA
jgi:tetratricopeptide (TPR) repeat protein